MYKVLFPVYKKPTVQKREHSMVTRNKMCLREEELVLLRDEKEALWQRWNWNGALQKRASERQTRGTWR